MKKPLNVLRFLFPFSKCPSLSNLWRHLDYGCFAFFPSALFCAVSWKLFLQQRVCVAVFFALPENCRFALESDAASVVPVVSVIIVENHRDLRVFFDLVELRRAIVGCEVNVFAVENSPYGSNPRLTFFGAGSDSTHWQILYEINIRFRKLQTDHPFLT
jgi:hypothetical protein